MGLLKRKKRRKHVRIANSRPLNFLTKYFRKLKSVKRRIVNSNVFSFLSKYFTKKNILFVILVLISIPLGRFAITEFRIWRVRAAATIIWDGNTDADGGDGISWNDPLNWSTDALPVDTDDVLIDTAITVNLSEPTTVHSLVIGQISGGVNSSLNFTYDSIGTSSPLTIDGGDLTVYSGGNITHSSASGNTIVGTVNLDVTVGNAYVYGNINTTGKGYPKTYGTGGTGTGGAGASHAGYGGRSGSTSIYGAMLQPLALGSGGGGGAGGNGGGSIKLTVTGDITVNGNILAKANNAGCGDSYGWYSGGGGSGGSIYIETSNLTGSGNISANGGSGADCRSRDGGGGSGGRISILYSTDNNLTASQITAMGGRGGTTYEQKGGTGTIFTKSPTQTYGDLRLDNVETNWTSDTSKYVLTPLDSEITMDNVFIDNFALVENNTILTTTNLNISNSASLFNNSIANTNDFKIKNSAYFYNNLASNISYSSLDWVGGKIIDYGGTFDLLDLGGDFEIPSGSLLEMNVARTFANVTVSGTLSHSQNYTQESNKLDLTSTGNITINAEGTVNVSGKGYTRNNGTGFGTGGGGASHAGYGGNDVGTSIYGSFSQPTSLGSGGGGGAGGNGGGSAKLTASGDITINGNIFAKANNAGCGDSYGWYSGGGGSGGSVYLNATSLSGSGTISANGGYGADCRSRDGGGGSGGRISLIYSSTNNLLATQILAMGGRGGNTSVQKGGAGTIYTKSDSQTYGELRLDNVETTWTTDRSKYAKTPFDNDITMDNIIIENFARIENNTTITTTNLNMSDSTIFYNNLTLDAGTLDINNSSYFYNDSSLISNNLDLTNSSKLYNNATINSTSLNIKTSSYFYNQIGGNTSYSSLDWVGGYLIDSGGTFPLLSSGGDLEIPATSTLEANTSRTLTNITVNGLLTHSTNYTDELYRIDLTATGDFVINSTGSVEVSERGFNESYGPGSGTSEQLGNGGGSHAGIGGNGSHASGGTTIYGSLTEPITLGSAGGDHNQYSPNEGIGGGALKLEVSGNLTVDGDISANGGNGSCQNDRGTGGGSGGSIWITASNISGTSSISANGGSASNCRYDAGGGSGGRIALYYTTNNLTNSQITAFGGKPNGGAYNVQRGGAGTIYSKATSQTNGDLRLDNVETDWSTDRRRYAVTPLNNPVTFDTILVDNFGAMEVNDSVTTTNLNIKNSGFFYNQNESTTSYSSLDWSGGYIIDNGGTFALLSGGGDLNVHAGSTLESNYPRTLNNITVSGFVTHTRNYSEALHRIDLSATGDFVINSTGSINVSERGFYESYGPGTGTGEVLGSGGASHGGTGGDGSHGAGSTNIYGSLSEPVSLGSAGGDHNQYSPNEGYGGGAIKLNASGNLTINGNIRANGGNGSCQNDRGTGGGSGGSIWLMGSNISGTANISTNGGYATNCRYDGGGGAGGRIALYYNELNILSENITSNGGTAYSPALPGDDGTIYLAGFPLNSINLNQFKSDGTTAIAIGGDTDQDNFVAKFQLDDANDTDTLTPEVEIQPLGTPFNNIATHTGTDIAYSGSTVTATVSIDGLADTVDYHWQARHCDSTSLCSEWVSAGANTEAEADISINMNALPTPPVIPESSYYINGQFTNYIQPTLDYVLSDPDTIDSVGYQVQIAADSEFTTPLVDYVSAMGAQGVQSFTVGQVAGDGTYNVGTETQELEAGLYFWRVKAIDQKGGESDWTVAPLNVAETAAFIIDLTMPTNATSTRMKAHLGAVTEYSESADTIWFNRNDLYFEWDGGSDEQGVKGYCVYLGQNETADPASEKGLLGTSPVSLTGSTCDFITSDTHIDFANSALRGDQWLTSSNDKYYFKVKTIDIANNVFDGPDETNFISFNFDNTQPENVTAISAPSSTFSSVAEIFFSWPTSEGNGGSDLHSGVLGFQYALNSKDTWYGDAIDPMTGLEYKLLTSSQPFFIPEEIQTLIQLGQNTIYFRVLDQAGNASELRTVYINYGGEAPKFAEGEEVTVTPSSNTVNNFGFSWPDAIVSEGNELETYYYMINSEPPTSYDTITSNSATYIATTETSIPEGPIPGLIKGSNTIHVVAIDKNHNYSPTNKVSANFILDTELPDPPTNLIVADSSIKDVSIWRAALIWDEPEYKGTGTLTYHIQRSEDGETWEDVRSTTGSAYIDTVEESKRYYWRVGTTDNSDQSIGSPSYSSAVTIIPKGKYTVPPTLTSGPAASSITTTKATLSWTTSRTADTKVAFGLASGNYFEWEPSMSEHTTEHLIPLSNLSPGTEYYYIAKWTDEDGNTGVSEEQTFTTAPPPEVKDVRISNLGISSAITNFTTKNASSVKIYYGTTTSFGGIKEIATSKLETSYSVELDNLEDGTKYFYRINTFDEDGEEYTSLILDFTTLPRPRVSNVLVQQVARTAESTLLVSWESNTEITSVVTFYPEKNPELMKDIVELDLKEGQHKMLVKGLLPNTTYILRVRGKDAIGNEAVSQNIRVTTSTDSRPPQISGVTIESTNVQLSEGTSQNTTSQLIVTWTTDEPATSQVEYGEGSSESYTQLTQEDKNLSYNHVVIISGLTPSKVYHLRAISKDAASNQSKSVDTVTITPKATDNAFYLVITTLQEAFKFLNNL